MNFEHHPHWPELQRIYHTLSQNGYKVYLAGGCVRDALLGREAHDLDLATDATPEAVEALFAKTVAVGKAFGVMLVVEGEVTFEVATFRSDGSYKDGRHPENIVFTTPEQDAHRRDFTVNALFYDLNEGRVLDFVGGLQDLEDKKIKAVGNPEERFREDHLRILRALRFSAQLGFEIDPPTLAAATSLASSLKSVSLERIHEEMLKVLKTQNPFCGLELLYRTGVGKVLFQNYQAIFAKYKKQYEDLFLSAEKEEGFLWYCFLAPWALNKDLGWEWILDNYRFPRLMGRNLKRALEQLENRQHFFLAAQGEQLSLLGEESTRMFLKLCRLLSLGGAQIDKLLQQWSAWGEKMPEPLVTGEDLKERFVGRDLGIWLHKLYIWQLEKRYLTREELLSQVI
ncbi:MAG: CCA tRNA nucleotidyltransferase [Bdellovibrionaceae bacterium]|nr:CCA tRNA nucleotidyltransferase [Pseudobdellovibrionaceae bacterium]